MAVVGRLYRDGNILKLHNFEKNPRIFMVEQFGFSNYLNDQIFEWIDTLSETGANAMRVFGFWPFGKGEETEPYVKSGDSYDLNSFDEKYFDYLQQWVSYANDKEIFVLYELFDSCGFWNAQYFPYNPFYQLVKDSSQPHIAFCDVTNSTFVKIQKAFIKKVIDTIQPEQNENVILGIMNEYKGSKDWHYEMSAYVKSLVPNTLTSGSEEDSPAAADPNVDLWFIHTGTYSFNSSNPNPGNGQPHVPKDAESLRKWIDAKGQEDGVSNASSQKIIGYSTDGFGSSHTFRENPTDMSNLAQNVTDADLQLFSFLDQKAYDSSGGAWPGRASLLNVDTYEAIASTFKPKPLPKDASNQTGELPPGYLDVFKVSRLPSTHKGAVIERRGKAIYATTEQGFLCYGQYRTDYPQKPLKAYFSILIDNNTADDRNILILDVYDHHSDRVIGKRTITRKDFPKANEFSLFEFDFTPPGAEAKMEFRIYYMGWSYVLADKIAIIDPSETSISEPSDIPNIDTTGEGEQDARGEDSDEGESRGEENSTYCSDIEILCLSSIKEKSVAQNQGRLLGGTFDNGRFAPSSTGGIEFSFTIDASRQFVVDFELEGNIPHWEKGEHDGGKPSLFTMYETGGHYYLNLQRMYRDYRGGGVFRVILGDRSELRDNAAFLPTVGGFGAYSMQHWGDEQHRFQIVVKRNQCQLKIDDNYISNWVRAPYDISGQRQVKFVLGNRESSALGYGQGALTRFRKVRILYL